MRIPLKVCLKKTLTVKVAIDLEQINSGDKDKQKFKIFNFYTHLHNWIKSILMVITKGLVGAEIKRDVNFIIL